MFSGPVSPTTPNSSVINSKKSRLIFVRIGSVDLDDFSLDRTYSHAIKKVYLYPDYYVDLNSVNDLALVEVSAKKSVV